MKKPNPALFRTLLWSVAGLTLVVLLGFSSNEQRSRPCQGLRIRIADTTGHYFIEPADIMDVLNTRGKKIKGTPMQDINMALLEKVVYSNPYVSRAEVYSTIDGYVNIDVWQRDPVMRIVNNDNEHYYIDRTGTFMPVSATYSSPVVVASGFIFDDYAESSLRYAVPSATDSTARPVLVQLYEISGFLKSHPFWDAQIEQVYVNSEGELELIPRVGNHTILIGNTDQLEEKMARLFVFYQEGINKAGWENYSRINLKFRNQVIGTRSARYKPNANSVTKPENKSH
jgi:cell division protein FtsQ